MLVPDNDNKEEEFLKDRENIHYEIWKFDLGMQIRQFLLLIYFALQFQLNYEPNYKQNGKFLG